jgi:predicted DNA-binding transcriptional regulator YafY
MVEELDNGDFIYELHVPEDEHFWYGTVLAFGNKIKVIEPPDLIERICRNCNEILKQYEEV